MYHFYTPTVIDRYAGTLDEVFGHRRTNPRRCPVPDGAHQRFVAATTLAFAAVFSANLVFAERFRRVGSSTIAFGTNLPGAMVGGVLEYSALVVGYRSLLVVAAVLYLAA